MTQSLNPFCAWDFWEGLVPVIITLILGAIGVFSKTLKVEGNQKPSDRAPNTIGYVILGILVLSFCYSVFEASKSWKAKIEQAETERFRNSEQSRSQAAIMLLGQIPRELNSDVIPLKGNDLAVQVCNARGGDTLDVELFRPEGDHQVLMDTIDKDVATLYFNNREYPLRAGSQRFRLFGEFTQDYPVRINTRGLVLKGCSLSYMLFSSDQKKFQEELPKMLNIPGDQTSASFKR